MYYLPISVEIQECGCSSVFPAICKGGSVVDAILKGFSASNDE